MGGQTHLGQGAQRERHQHGPSATRLTPPPHRYQRFPPPPPLYSVAHLLHSHQCACFVLRSASGGGVLVLGATNVPWELDPAVRRRFERRVYVPLPDGPARRRLLELHLGATPHALTPAQLDQLAQQMDGLSGADISVLVRDALMAPLRELQGARTFRQRADGWWEPCGEAERGAKRMQLMDIPGGALLPPPVTRAHFEAALRTTKPSVAQAELGRYEQFTREFGAGSTI